MGPVLTRIYQDPSMKILSWMAIADPLAAAVSRRAEFLLGLAEY